MAVELDGRPATDPAAEWDGRAWGATDRIRSLPPAIGLGAALDAFCAGKAAEGLSPRSIVWYRMIGERLVGRFSAARPVDTGALADTPCPAVGPQIAPVVRFPDGSTTDVRIVIRDDLARGNT